MTDSFSPTKSGDTVVHEAGENSLKLFYIGIASFFGSVLSFAIFMITGENQAIRVRKQYFSSILKQEIGWFDKINPTELASKVANESFDWQNAIGEKVGTLLMTLSMCLSSLVIGYFYGWQLSLVLTAALPVI